MLALVLAWRRLEYSNYSKNSKAFSENFFLGYSNYSKNSKAFSENFFLVFNGYSNHSR